MKIVVAMVLKLKKNIEKSIKMFLSKNVSPRVTKDYL